MIFEDSKKYQVPARVVATVCKNGRKLAFVRLFLEPNAGLDGLNSKKEQNLFLSFTDSIQIQLGDLLFVSCKGLLLNQFVLENKIDLDLHHSERICNFLEKIDDSNIVTYENKLQEFGIINQLEEINKKISEEKELLKQEKEQLEKILEENSREKNQLDIFLKNNEWLNKVKPYIVDKNNNTNINDESISNDQFKVQFNNIVKAIKNRFNLSDNFIYCYLSSLFTSLIQGRFLLLTGHIGTGKSSIIKETGKLMGGQTNMIAVRPAWLDSSDLLGYFDPINNRYHTTDFLKFLRKEDNNRINMILLDELNIARIENYGADILACLSPIGKRQEEQNKIQLFNQDLQELIYTYQLFEELADDKKQRYQPILDRIKQSSSVVIPDNVLICGTLNIDGSTENLSPKMIDRSFMLKFPDFNGRLDKTEEEIVGQYNVPMHQIITILERQDKISVEKWNNFYDHFIKDIENLLIPISNRVAKDYLVFRQFAEIFNLGDAEKIDALFFYARILPRLRIERTSSENKDNFVKILKKFGRMDIFENFINVIDSEPNGSFIDYQHICG